MAKYQNNWLLIFTSLLVTISTQARGQNVPQPNNNPNIYNNSLAQLVDLSNHWTAGCLNYLQEKSIINATRDLRLNEPIKRAEFAAMLAQAYQNISPVREAVNFLDVPNNHWGKSAIQSAYTKGFMNSYAGILFNPTASMTRTEVLLALTNGLKFTTSENIDMASLKQTFRDAQDIPEYARNSILAATEKGLIINYPDPQILNPNLISTRWDVATLICQSLRVKNNANINMSGEYVVKINPISKTSQVIKQYSRDNLQVILSYDRPNPQAEETGLLTNLNLQIQRGNTVLLKNPILLANTNTPLPSRPQDAVKPQAKIIDVKLADLQGDNELEVIVDLIAINSNVPDGSYSFIYEYSKPNNQYALTAKAWGNLQYNLTDFNNDRVLEFNSFDWRFASAYPDTMANVGNYLLPIQIWRYSQGNMIDVTRQFPLQVKNSAANLWLEFNKKSQNNQETKGVLASYLATQYLLNQPKKGWDDLKRFYNQGDRTDYFKNLSEFLSNTGYMNNNPNISSNSQSTIIANPLNTTVANPINNLTNNPTSNLSVPNLTQAVKENAITSIVLSPNSQIVASTSGKNILLWSVTDKKLLATLLGHNGDVRSLAISADSNILASGSGDGTVKLWDINSGELIKTFWHSGWVTGVAFSADNKAVIGVSSDKGVRMWDIETATIIRTMNGIGPIATAPASQLMLTSGGPRTLRLWRTDGQLIKNFSVVNPQSVPMRAIALSDNGEIMAHTITGENNIYLWNILLGKMINTINIKSGPVEAIALSPNGLALAVVAQDGKTSLWHTKNNQLLREFNIGENGTITFMPDSQILISVDSANGVQFWQVRY
ncbi:MAG: S-layer homology domain-containing protein [Microcoleaceae cyanobacterium]